MLLRLERFDVGIDCRRSAKSSSLDQTAQRESERDARRVARLLSRWVSLQAVVMAGAGRAIGPVCLGSSTDHTDEGAVRGFMLSDGVLFAMTAGRPLSMTGNWRPPDFGGGPPFLDN